MLHQQLIFSFLVCLLMPVSVLAQSSGADPRPARRHHLLVGAQQMLCQEFPELIPGSQPSGTFSSDGGNSSGGSAAYTYAQPQSAFGSSMQAGAGSVAPPVPKGLPLAAGTLPQVLTGKWLVTGDCTKLDIRPDLADKAQSGFNRSSSETWSFKGKPGKYVLSSKRGAQKIEVGNCTSDMAFFNRRHVVGKAKVQQLEAVAIQLQPDGKTFSGFERITVSAPGETSFRARATYQLSGTKQ